MTLTQIIVVLAARWKLILASLVVFGVIGLLVSVLLPSRYTATASILVDTKGVDPVGGNERAQIANQTIMTTQADTLTSQRVALRVVKQLNLTNMQTYKDRWMDDADGQGDFASFIADTLLRFVEVKPSKDSSVLEVAFTARDPKFAAKVANAFVQNHIETSLEMRVEPARQFSAWFDERTKRLREAVEVAQGRLSAFQRSRGLVAVGPGQIDVENAKLAGLTTQLIEIKAMRADSRSRQAQASGNIDMSPDVINSPVIATLRTEVAKAEVFFKQLSGQLGTAHPDVQRARDNLTSLKAQLQSQMTAIARTVGGTDVVNSRREAELTAAVKAQTQRVLELTTNSSEMSVLQRDLDSARQAYDAAATRQGQTALESQMQQTNVFVLTTATEPGIQSFPRVKLNTICATALGLLVGIAAALLLEARSPIVRSVDDLSAVVDLPIMAVVSWAKVAVPKSAQLLQVGYSGQVVAPGRMEQA